MSINNFTCYENEILTWIRKSDSSSKIGFEREGLRIRDSLISKESHPAKLGSALCNNYITTDFSEAQLELVTPAYEDKKVAIQFLRDIHHFVSNKLGDEYLWPFSMPINVESDKDILIASYGNSNLAKFKQIYRNGLSERYGKMMQIISGVHYNYSVPESIWKSELFKKRGLSAKDSRSKVYFNMLRNLYRFNWIVIYLFGASPIVSSTFLKSNRESFKELNDDAFYLPYATSLRMSSYGYQNRRRKLPVSLNSIDEYISDLRKATLTSDPEFNQIKNSNQAQISDSILQIDDEYYAIARVKSQSRSEQRTTSKLMKWGVDFIELRSLDLDPFSRTGINEETVYFLEVFLTYCFIKQEKKLEKKEIENIDINDELVATTGRKPDLKIMKGDKDIKIRDWGNMILDDLWFIAETLDSVDCEYSKAIIQARERINNPRETLSGQLLDQITSQDKGFIEFGLELAKKNKHHYLNTKEPNNYNHNFFEKEANRSINEQKELEISEKKSFDRYLEEYFKK